MRNKFIVFSSLAILFLGSCKKNDSGTPSGNVNHGLIHKITEIGTDTTVYTLSYNVDSSVADVDVQEYGAHAYTIHHTYTGSYNLSIKDYGGGFSERDSTVLSGGKVTAVWHTDLLGTVTHDTYIYGTDGNISKAINYVPGKALDSIVYQWQSGNITSAVSSSDNYSFSYDIAKPFQPGDYFYLNTLMNNRDLTFNVVNSNLLTGVSANSLGNLQFIYTWDNAGRITQCKQHNVTMGDDTFWNITY